jgi:hypothetical protein
MNRAGQKPEKLVSENMEVVQKAEDTFLNMVGQEDINRFNQPKGKQRKKKRRPPNRNPNQKPQQKPKKAMKKAIILFSLFGIILAGFTSCDSGRVFDQYQKFLILNGIKIHWLFSKFRLAIRLKTTTCLFKFEMKRIINTAIYGCLLEIEQPGGECCATPLKLLLPILQAVGLEKVLED